MRVSALVVAGALALGLSAVSANAAPAAPDLGVTTGSPNIIEVAGGCGRGFHPNPWGRCVPNRTYGYDRPYWHGPYYRWHSPSDFVANDLNQRQLYRPWGY